MFGVAAICSVIWFNYTYPPPSAQAQQLQVSLMHIPQKRADLINPSYAVLCAPVYAVKPAHWMKPNFEADICFVLCVEQAEDQWAGLRTVAVIITWIVVLYTQCTTLLFKWASMTLSAALSHAILRCTVSEDVEALGSHSHAGVPLMAFLGDIRTRDQPEPRKLAHQIAAVLHEQAGLLWNQAKFYSYYLADAVRYPYVLCHHLTDRRHT